MKSYLNDPSLKERFVAEVKKHRDADMIVQKTYGRGEGDDWKGCAVGCSLRSLDIMAGKDLLETYDTHARYETELGMPEWLARLEDTLFEGLSVEEAKEWPLKFAESVPVGVDLGQVKWKFCAYLMKENIEQVLSLDIADDLNKQVVDAIRQVLTLNESAIETGVWDESAARSAAESAESAESAAESAESARSAAWSAAESAAYTKQSEKLLELLREAQ